MGIDLFEKRLMRATELLTESPNSNARIIPGPLWDRFSDQYGKATGLWVVACGSDGLLAFGGAHGFGLCPVGAGGKRQRCTAFYGKAARQAARGDDTVLFRCPYGFLVFAVPVRLHEGVGVGTVVLMGGPAKPQEPFEKFAAGISDTLRVSEEEALALIGRMPAIAPRALTELANLAHLCLQSVIQGDLARQIYSTRHAQLMTLFEVVSDLTRTTSANELYALALNALGVLFDVGCAAILLRKSEGNSFHTQTAMGNMEKDLLFWSVPADTPLLDRLGQPGISAIHLDDPHSLAKLGLPDVTERLSVFPLWNGQNLRGVLALLDTDLRGEEEQMIRGLATQLSWALESLTLRDDVAKKTEQLQTVQELSRQFLSCLETDHLLQAILREAERVTGASKGSVMLETEEGGEMLVKAVIGTSEGVVGRLRVRKGQGIAGHVFSTGEPILVQNVESDSRFRRRNRPRYVSKSFVSFPLRVDRGTVGVLNLSDKVSGEIFSAEDVKLLHTMFTQAAIAIERSIYCAQSEALRQLSITDSLTGLPNRRYFNERLTEEVDRAIRHGHPLALIMIDIDHFKAYNDAQGHPAGDKALALVGRTLRGNIRTIDVVSRVGGEEFAMILPETRKDEALEIGERIRADIEQVYFPGEESLPSGRLTISLGVADFPEDARDLKALIQRADRALYCAKAQGRNQIAAYRAPETRRAGSTTESAWTKVL